MAMIYWVDNFVGFIAELIRACFVIGVPLGFIWSVQSQSITPFAFSVVILLASHLVVIVHRFLPLLTREFSERAASRP
jgi:hypothetical protein